MNGRGIRGTYLFSVTHSFISQAFLCFVSSLLPFRFCVEVFGVWMDVTLHGLIQISKSVEINGSDGKSRICGDQRVRWEIKNRWQLVS